MKHTSSTPRLCVLASVIMAACGMQAQATETSNQYIATAGAQDWTGAITTDRWSNTPPWTLPATGGPNATSRLDLASSNGSQLQISTGNQAVQELTVSVATVTQYIQVYGPTATLTIGNAGSKNGLLSVTSGALSLYANASTAFNVVLNGNANIASGASFYLGIGTLSTNTINSFLTTGTTTITGGIFNKYSSTNTKLGDVVLGSTGSLTMIVDGTAPSTINRAGTLTLQATSLSGSGTVNGTNISGGDSGGAQDRIATLLINTSTLSNATFAGKISNGVAALKGTNTTNLRISGSGRQTLTGNNTYTGSTSITGGTLILSGTGSINQTSGITINGGSLQSSSSVALTRNVTLTSGTFSYSTAGNYTGTFTYTAGTLGGTNWNGSLDNRVIGAGKTINPGNSPGTASTGTQTWASGGALNWEINDATGSAGTNWDQILLSNSLSITSTSDTRFTINIYSLAGLTPGDAANFNSATSYLWLLADASAAITTFSEDKFTLNLAGFTNAYDGTWSIVRGDTTGTGDSSQLYLNYTAVPEPGTFALAAIGLGGIALMRRRFSAKNH